MEQWIQQKTQQKPTTTSFTVPILATKLQIDAEKQKECVIKLNDIIEMTYADIKNTPTYKTWQKKPRRSKQMITILPTTTMNR